MEAKKLFAVVGTDARQAAAGRVLERAGYAVGGAEQVALADYILLPLPLDAGRNPRRGQIIASCLCRGMRPAPRWQSCCGPQSPARWHWAAGSQFRQRPSHRKLAWSWWITLPDRS